MKLGRTQIDLMAEPAAIRFQASVPRPEEEFNFWRDTPLRYLGYINEVGEATEQYIGHKAAKASYGIAAAYALCDVVYLASKEYKRSNHLPTPVRLARALREAGDAAIFHTIATVIVPALIIKVVRKNVQKFLMRPELSKALTRIASPVASLVGLSLIPFIPHPLDKLTDSLLNWTYRPLVGKNRIIGGLRSVPADEAAPHAMNFVLKQQTAPRPTSRPATISEPKTFKIMFG